ncbi:MAG TPA: hypothetical protein PK325_12760 [Cyclobacteriaceae bacterium]|nr:hypothetical protein [Cyclobacteriaceae bacterium]HND17256.1 hypothetical protein [Saprospiraceae bacterium]HMV09757.1 hypothetical protein [Cyclobacteriaceae bacterium]HMV88796.1 hypothetical protein [Cyclobacteriaceae bacterium]HMX02310.1 hypothetical protein [Cyclobacteriaceae bacterium]
MISSKLTQYTLLFTLFSVELFGQKIPLTTNTLMVSNVTLEQAAYHNRKAIRITGTSAGEKVALVKNFEFKNGIIELEVAGKPLPDTDPSFRGFIGIAFRLRHTDSLRYECFYIRPTNGRAEDQLRRNHSTQYISHPQHTWQKLRRESPGVYESYTDLIAGEWTKLKIIVNDKDARLYVNDSDQPCLIVTQLKGEVTTGSIALWIGIGTDGYFRNLKVTKTKSG